MLRDRLRRRQESLPAVAVGVLLTEYAGPAEVPPELAEATLRAAVGDDDRAGPLLPPLVPPAESPVAFVSGEAESTGAPRISLWRRSVLALAVLLAAASVGVAGVVTYRTLDLGGPGGPLSSIISLGDGSGTPVNPAPGGSCH